MSLNSDASMIVTAGLDRSVRAFYRSEEIIFANEQREEDMEKEQDEDEANKLDKTSDPNKAVAGHQTVGSLKAGEALSETIRFVMRELEEEEEKEEGTAEAKPAAPNPLLLGKTPHGYLVWKLEGVKAAELPHAITLLPYSECLSLLKLLHQIFTATGPQSRPMPPMGVELATKVVMGIVQLHKGFLVQQGDLSVMIEELRDALRAKLQKHLDEIGFTRASLGFLQRKMEVDMHSRFFDLSKRKSNQKGQRKRKKE